MKHSPPSLGLAFLFLVGLVPLPAAAPTPYIDYMLTSRTAIIVLDCDPPSCRTLMNKDEDFEYDFVVIHRARRWMKDWGRLRILDDIREADLVVHLDCGQPDFADLLYGLRKRWMKMEVYPGRHDWRNLEPIWKRRLNPVPACDCRDAVLHILAEYRADIERLDRARAAALVYQRRGRRVLPPAKIR
jgi:hypothetical protein